MSMSVSPVKAVMSAVNTAAPKTMASKAASLGESIMPREEKSNRTKNIIFTIIKTFADKAKSKPDSERNLADYIFIIVDKLKDINPVKYAA